MSIAFPMVMHMIFSKGSFSKSPFLKFITVLLPLSCSAVQHLLLFRASWKESTKPEGAIYKVLRYFSSALFITFAVTSILSVIAFAIHNWKYNTVSLSLSIIFPSLLFPPTYLLSTSCCLVPGQIGFTDTGINILIDILILVHPMANLVSVRRRAYRYPHSAIISSIFLIIIFTPDNLNNGATAFCSQLSPPYLDLQPIFSVLSASRQHHIPAFLLALACPIMGLIPMIKDSSTIPISRLPLLPSF
ncbi:DUF2463 domain-containing protein [Encephalitozoon cuniculi]|nr:DUF2463 domain-containing protein [Encephalitozoon cuniculi]